MKPWPVAIVGLLLLSSCGDPAASGPTAMDPAPVVEAPAGPHAVVVFATASLRRPFESIARRYELDHPGAKVTLRCDGGNQLLNAMNAGEKCDVVAIGDNSLMSKFAAAAHLANGSPTELARNRVAIVVAKGNGKQVKGLADFGRADVKVALGARSSSIGRHGRWVLSRLQLDPKPACEANTADGVVAKVAGGEADAGIVYVTSIAASDDKVEMVAVPEADNTPVLYSISAVRAAKEPKGAAAFRAMALGPVGQQLLHDAGFLAIGAKM